MARKSKHSILVDSFYDWFVNFMKESSNMDVDELKDPIGTSFKDSYVTIAKDLEYKIWLRLGRRHHIISFDEHKDGVMFYDFLPMENHLVRFIPKESLRPEDREGKPLNNEEFCGLLKNSLDKSLTSKRYFTLPFNVSPSAGSFYNSTYEHGYRISVDTRNNVSTKGTFLEGFMPQFQGTVLKTVRDVYKEQKGICVWEAEEILHERYADIFMLGYQDRQM